MIPEKLHDIINCLGHTDMEVTGKSKGGHWLKWKKVLCSKKINWSNITERTVAPCEIVLDYDEYSCPRCGALSSNIKCSNCGIKFNKIKRKKLIEERVFKKIEELKKENLKFKAYKTGGKGYHIHLIFPELCLLSKLQRKKKKIEIIKKFGGEILKATDRVMIMIEGRNHRKTGNPKELIFERKGKNYGIIEWNRGNLFKKEAKKFNKYLLSMDDKTQISQHF